MHLVGFTVGSFWVSLSGRQKEPIMRLSSYTCVISHARVCSSLLMQD